MLKFLEFQKMPKSALSRACIFVIAVGLLVLATIAIVQFLKEKNGIYLFKTEYLSMVVCLILCLLGYVFLIFVAKRGFVWYELCSIPFIAMFFGTYASIVAEKLFRQKK